MSNDIKLSTFLQDDNNNIIINITGCKFEDVRYITYYRFILTKLRDNRDNIYCYKSNNLWFTNYEGLEYIKKILEDKFKKVRSSKKIKDGAEVKKEILNLIQDLKSCKVSDESIILMVEKKLKSM